MKVVTSRMKEAVNKAIKGAGFNNLIPITSMLGIKLSDGKLRLLTTDMTNTLCIIIDKVAGDDMDITVDADKFGKLIAKTTSEDIELIIIDDVLSVKANGTYKIPLISDEEGLVSFPDIKIMDDKNVQCTTKLSSVMQAYNINKSALAKTLEEPALTGYYCDDTNVITTDGCVITFNGFKMFEYENPILVSAQQMQLLTLNTNEDINVYIGSASILFVTEDVVIDGALMEGIENFPVDSIKAYLDEAFTSSCKVPKDLLLATLDRLALFIEPYDKNGAYFTFGRKGINIHSKKDASTETINYVESKDFEPFMCCVDIPMLKEQLQANPDDTVKICYGNENALKIESGKVTQVIALLEDEDLDNMTE
jgi:DNA polymerase III sliding clamp (beta) subunit (PCNA family)